MFEIGRLRGPGDIEQALCMAASTQVFTPAELLLLRSDLENPEDDFLLAAKLDDGRMAGFVQVGALPITDGSWCLHWIAVERLCQGKGLGKILISRAEEAAKKSGAKRLFIETSSRPPFFPARSLYIKAGYSQVAELPGYYGAQDHKCVFAKNL